jgi:hypothetical protein
MGSLEKIYAPSGVGGAALLTSSRFAWERGIAAPHGDLATLRTQVALL